MTGRRIKKSGPGFFFLLPSLLGISLFVLIPFADIIRRSFSSVMGGRLVGFANYRTVLQNQAFRLAAGNTARFLLVSIPLLLALSLLLALILYSAGAWAGVLKTAYLIPMAIPVASIVLLWQVLFDAKGLVNGMITHFGGAPTDWMNLGSAFWVLVGTFVWKNIGYDIVLWLAGLAAIPKSLYEAAKVDGAGTVRIFRQITLPNLLPSLYTILVLSLLSAFKVFREAYLVAGDYPHSSIYLLQHLFGNWFRELDMEKLSAAAVLVAIVIIILILIMRKIWEDE